LINNINGDRLQVIDQVVDFSSQRFLLIALKSQIKYENLKHQTLLGKLLD